MATPEEEVQKLQEKIERDFLNIKGPYGSEIKRVLKLLQKSSGESKTRAEETAALMLAAIAGAYGEGVSEDYELTQEAQTEIKAIVLSESDAGQLLREVFLLSINRYKERYGVSELTEADVQYMADAVAFEFQVPNYTADRDYGETSAERKDRRKIYDILDDSYFSKSQDTARQPLYPTKDLQQAAFLEAAINLDVASYDATQDYLREFQEVWPQLKLDLEEQSTADNPALKTLSKRLLLRTKGLEGTNEDYLNYGWVDTIWSDNPLTKEEFARREEARAVSTDLTEDDLNALMKNPHKWVEDYLGNTLTYDFQTGEAKATQDIYKRYIKETGDALRGVVRRLREETDEVGGLKYSPEDILSMAGSAVQEEFKKAPNIPYYDQMIKAGMWEGTKEYNDLQKEIEDAQKEEQEAQEEQQKLGQEQFEAQTTRDQDIFDLANSKPEDFKEKYLTDPDYQASVDATLNRYKERGKPIVDKDKGEITFSSPMGITPSGRIAPFPDVTYIDPITGLVETMSAKDVPFNLGPDSPISGRLKPFLEWQYSLTPEQQFDMQMGGAPPSLPPNIAASLMGPPPLRGDIYTTGPGGEQIPYYSNPPVDEYAKWNQPFAPMFPGSQGIPNYIQPPSTVSPAVPSMGLFNMPGSNRLIQEEIPTGEEEGIYY